MPTVSIHVLRRGRCVEIYREIQTIFSPFQSTSSEEDVVSTHRGSHFRCNRVSIHVLRRGRCVTRTTLLSNLQPLFQSTSSEEDVVSTQKFWRYVWGWPSFNPRPPKRTLCRAPYPNNTLNSISVSIHVLRRGRCVAGGQFQLVMVQMFQSTSSEEDVVSYDTKYLTLRQ